MGWSGERVLEVGVPKAHVQRQATEGPPLLCVDAEVPRRRSSEVRRAVFSAISDGRAAEEDVTGSRWY